MVIDNNFLKSSIKWFEKHPGGRTRKVWAFIAKPKPGGKHFSPPVFFYRELYRFILFILLFIQMKIVKTFALFTN
jgi:hypothetical protein